MDLQLRDKVALIAGATAGLGLATAKVLLQEGAKVMICGRSSENLAKALAECQRIDKTRIAGRVVDVANQQACQQWVRDTLDTFSGIDIVITNAGGPKSGGFSTLDTTDYQNAYATTLFSAIAIINASLPHLEKSKVANILTITSISTKQPIAGLTLSNIFRPAVIGLTKTLAQELGPKQIRVNSILPGWTATERTKALLTHRAASNQSLEAEEMAKIEKSIPLQRFATPEEFAKVAAFLVSPAASYITGTMLQVDGGIYAGLL